MEGAYHELFWQLRLKQDKNSSVFVKPKDLYFLFLSDEWGMKGYEEEGVMMMML